MHFVHPDNLRAFMRERHERFRAEAAFDNLARSARPPVRTVPAQRPAAWRPVPGLVWLLLQRIQGGLIGGRG